MCSESPRASTRNVASEGDDSGGCIWGTLSTSLQVTAFTGAQLAQRKLGWQATVPSVGGVGNGAWSRGPLTIANLDSVVLYVDYGDFGLEFAANAPGVTTAKAVTLAKAIT